MDNSVNKPQVVIAKPLKSVGIALLLTFLFGPFGMLYSTIAGGLIMLIVDIVVAIFTLGLGLFVTWPIKMIWAALAANSYNKKVMKEAR